jgi:hypothetical protein
MRYANRLLSGGGRGDGPWLRSDKRKIALLSAMVDVHKPAGLAEGVGFEPTVGFPTLDFESSALNRTQPPFLEAGRKRPTPNVQHPTFNANGP